MPEEIERELIPKQVFIDPTGACFNKCKRCISRNEEMTPRIRDLKLSIHEMLSIFDDVTELGIQRVQFTGGGDPLAHPKIKTALKYLRGRGIHFGVTSSLNLEIDNVLLDLLLSTRGISKYPLGVSGISTSVWASNPKRYAHIHGVGEECFNRVVNNIRTLINGGTSVYIAYVLMPENAKDVYPTISLANDLKCTKFWMIKAYHPLRERLLTNLQVKEVEEQLSRAKKDFEILIDTSSLYLDYSRKQRQRYCSYTLFRAHVGADALVYPCWIHKYHPEFSYGDLRKQRLKDILTSEKRIKALTSLECRTHFCKFKKSRFEHPLLQRLKIERMGEV